MRIFAFLIYSLAAGATFTATLVYTTGWYLEENVAGRKLATMGLTPSQASLAGAIAANRPDQIALLHRSGVHLEVPAATRDRSSPRNSR